MPTHPFQLTTAASIDMGNDDDLLDLMSRAGFWYVFIGIETPDPDTLRAINKVLNTHTDVFANIRKIQGKGMEVMGGFIIGFDTDPEDIADRQFDFIQNAGIPSAMAGLLTVFPNTQLYRRLEKEGRLKHESSGNNMDAELNFVSVRPERTLINDYKRLIQKLYTPENYLKRCDTLIKNLPRRHLIYNMIFRTDKFRQFMGFRKAYARYLLPTMYCYSRLMFTTTYGSRTLGLTFKLLVTRPFQLDVAFLLILKGYHYVTLARQIAPPGSFR